MSTINVKDEPIKWEELTKYINKPVYDAFCKKWYILYGYKEFTKKVIVVGNEANGVSKEILEYADEKIKIPMLGKTESLNASVATGIVVFEASKQRI